MGKVSAAVDCISHPLLSYLPLSYDILASFSTLFLFSSLLCFPNSFLYSFLLFFSHSSLLPLFPIIFCYSYPLLFSPIFFAIHSSIHLSIHFFFFRLFLSHLTRSLWCTSKCGVRTLFIIVSKIKCDLITSQSLNLS